MRLAFLGTPEPAVPTLAALVAAGHDVRCVVTRPDKRRGRGSDLLPSPVKSAAIALNLPVIHRLSELNLDDVDLVVVVAYGVIIPASMLARAPMLNVHFSLLPRWRGAAPVQRAILAGDQETGVTIISLEETLDTGPIHAEAKTLVEEKTAATLFVELAAIGAQLLVDVLANDALLGNASVQSGDVTYADKITKEELRLDPLTPAEQCRRIIRVGGAHMQVDGKRLAVLRASASHHEIDNGHLRFVEGSVVAGTSKGAFVLLEVRPEGAKSMDAAAWWRGRFSSDEIRTWS